MGFLLVVSVSIGTSLLASRKGRNPVDWFFLSLFWSIGALLVIACSRRINSKAGETDSLAKLLWIIVIVPLVVLVYLFLKVSLK